MQRKRTIPFFVTILRCYLSGWYSLSVDARTRRNLGALRPSRFLPPVDQSHPLLHVHIDGLVLHYPRILKNLARRRPRLAINDQTDDGMQRQDVSDEARVQL